VKTRENTPVIKMKGHKRQRNKQQKYFWCYMCVCVDVYECVCSVCVVCVCVLCYACVCV